MSENLTIIDQFERFLGKAENFYLLKNAVFMQDCAILGEIARFGMKIALIIER